MNEIIIDVAVIGAGSAGLPARREAEKHGASALLIEDGPYGTTCARVGCMPSKLLIAAADAAHHAEHAPQFGVHPGPISVDGPAVFDRVRRERDRFAGFVVKATEGLGEAKSVRGRATFVAPTTLQVGDHTLIKAKAVVIATGSSPWLPPPLRPVADLLMDNADVFELEDVPKTVAVIGTGVIGLELGQSLSRLGAEVKFFAIDQQLGPVSDPVIKAKTVEVLGDELNLALDTFITQAKAVEGGVALTWRTRDGQEGVEVFEKVLAATGRRPNLRGMGLEELGLDTDTFGVPVFDGRTMQIGEHPIFIAGDVTNDRPLLHEASDEGRIAGVNAARVAQGDPARAHARRAPMSVVFSEPQMGMAGLSYAQLEARGQPFGIGEVSYDNQGRARVMGRNRGHVRIYGDPSDGRLLGAELFGPDVEHLTHLLAWAIQLKLTVVEVLRMPFYHPVTEEGLRTALRDLAHKLKLADRGEIRCVDCPPGS